MPASASRAALNCRLAKRAASKRASRGRRLRMTAVLTTIYAEVVKTRHSQFWRFQCVPLLRAVRPACRSCFRNLVHLGFCGSELPLGELGGVSREYGLRMAGFLTTPTRVVAKTAIIRNLELGTHVRQVKSRPFALAGLATSHRRASPSRIDRLCVPASEEPMAPC